MSNLHIINRELSWLSFNERVLQEAESTDVPLLERLKFLGIYSNNLDEFFRVRVATITRMLEFQKQAKKDLGENPKKLLDKIQQKTTQLQFRFNKAYQNILRDLEKENIFIINEKQLSIEQGIYIKKYFREKVRLEIFPIMLDTKTDFPNLQDTSIYLAVRFWKNKLLFGTKDYHHSLIEVPSATTTRFVVLPTENEQTFILFLDDVIRYNLDEIYKIYDFDTIEAYTIKFTRDAELDIDNDVSNSFLESVELSLQARKKAEPLRFIYDEEMPKEFLHFLIKKIDFSKEGHVIGGYRYHNFKDFIRFPNIGKKEFWYQYKSQLPHPYLHKCKSIIDKMKEKDMLLYYPYHSFDYFLDLVREAAIDPNVSHIRITLYRVASDSHVIKSLITAVRNGKDVTVFVELRARFDEEANIHWANKLREEGAKVITGIAGLKVHSKICLITRRENHKKIYYATIGTGNMHEKTSKIYTDAMLFTGNQLLTREVRLIFDFFDKNYLQPKIHKLLLAPFTLRSKIIQYINREIRHAKIGKRAEIFLKLNNLVDTEMVNKLYQASKNGVKVRLIVRGICALIPQLPNISENIEAISIIDKFLEHTRVFIFHNNGNPDVLIGSADLMARNLDNRVEVVTPIIDTKIKQQLIDIMELQWKDNVKARIFDKDQNNEIKKRTIGLTIRSQEEIYDYWQNFFESNVMV